MTNDYLFDWKKVLSIQNDVLSEINQLNPTKDILNKLTDRLDELDEGHAVTVLLNTPDGLWPSAGRRIPSAWVKLISPLAAGPVQGSCGTAVYRKDTVIVENILEDPLWADFKEYQPTHGFMACWSQPFFVQGDVFGTFAIYFKEPRKPSENEIEVFKSLAISVGIIIERKKNDDEVAKLHLELQKLSLRDGLTGISNRRMFDLELEKEWKRAQRNHSALSLIMIDIDYFKKYNDHYGHQQGDNCLKLVAQALKHVSKRSIDCVARYGGEEFVILIPETDADNVKEMGEKCCRAIMELKIPHVESYISNVVTISVGVCTVIPEANVPSSSLVSDADNYLYLAKNNGRNRVEHS